MDDWQPVRSRLTGNQQGKVHTLLHLLAVFHGMVPLFVLPLYSFRTGWQVIP
jgi:hypothetical protein